MSNKMSKSLATYIADYINERLVYRNEDGGTDYHIYANLILDAVDAYYEIGHQRRLKMSKFTYNFKKI